LNGDFVEPADPAGVVLFAHGSGSSRRSPRNRYVASELQKGRFATLLMDLLTDEEERIDDRTGRLRFDIELLAGRLVEATDWLTQYLRRLNLPLGYFGASTGAAAALLAASRRPDVVRAVVCRGGRPDLAGPALPLVTAPTLLIVGSEDDVVIRLNRQAQHQMNARTELEIVPGAGHLFEEAGTLEQVARSARSWFEVQLARRRAA
jgi:pimeloyl-ACP methyl ester carboxylesterase